MSTQSTPFAAAQQRFVEQGLVFPHVPEEFQDTFQAQGEWVWGTRIPPCGLYDLPRYLEEVGTRPVADYLLLGHAGHGIQSYAMHYYLVRGPLALFVQLEWGGAYTDAASAAPQVSEVLSKAGQLVQAVRVAEQQGQFAAGERLIVVVSDNMGCRWARLTTPQPDLRHFVTAPGWHEDPTPLDTLLAQFAPV